MAHAYFDIAYTPSVKAAQVANGSGAYWAEFKGKKENNVLTAAEGEFIATRDSFYMATVSETGWPYVQHRGGPPGFLKVLGPNLIGFADFKGNCQLVSTGNLGITDRVALFMMDYPHRTRLKLLGHARVLDARTIPSWSINLPPRRSEAK